MGFHVRIGVRTVRRSELPQAHVNGSPTDSTREGGLVRRPPPPLSVVLTSSFCFSKLEVISFNITFTTYPYILLRMLLYTAEFLCESALNKHNSSQPSPRDEKREAESNQSASSSRTPFPPSGVAFPAATLPSLLHLADDKSIPTAHDG